MGTVSLRPYQAEALQALREARDGAEGQEAIRRALVVLATGLGKTVVLASIPEALGLIAGEAILVIAHREELIRQAAAKFASVAPHLKIGIEQAEQRADADCDVIVASVMTLKEQRLDRFVRTFAHRLAIIAIDEAHHAVAPVYQAIVSALPGAFVVGVTATPKRGDEVGLGEVFDRIVIHRDLQWGIEHGYLVPLRSYVTRSNVDLSGVSTLGKNGDFVEGQLAKAVNQEARNALVVRTYRQHAAGLKALVFCAAVEHARAVSLAFCDQGIAATWVSGNTPAKDRAWIVKQFSLGKILVLVNVGVFTEGFDDPTVEVIINARPTRSVSLYTQIVGRGLRPLDDCAGAISVEDDSRVRCGIISRSAKPSAIVIDILDGDVPRPGLQSLPSLWGLPVQFDARGEDVREVIRKYEAVATYQPEMAKLALDVSQFDVAIQEIDAFAPPVPDPVAMASSKNNWLTIPGEGHRLSLPPAYVPIGVDANHLAEERRKVGHMVRDAMSRGDRDPIAAVEAEIGRKVATIEEWVEIRPTLLGRWEAEVYQRLFRGTAAPRERSRVIADENDRTEAFRMADAWLIKNRRDFLTIADRSAPWRFQEISPAQRRNLSKRFGVPDHLLPKTKGEATDLITRLKNEGRGRVARSEEGDEALAAATRQEMPAS